MKLPAFTALFAAASTLLFAFPLLAAEPAVVVEDRERIQNHLQEVEAELRARDVSHLSEELREERRRNLDVLREYRKAGEFPRNTHVPWRHPVFIDRDDRACAVGYLMIRSGWEKEARNISRRENLAYLLDMESPEVERWVAQSGLTAEEAARIQPGYSPCMDCGCDEQPVCGEDGKTYLNSCTATTCAGVQVLHEGCCEDGAEFEHDIDDPWYECPYFLEEGESEICHGAPGGGDAGHGEPDAGHPGADAGGGGANDPTTGSQPNAPVCATAATGPGGFALGALTLLALIGLRRTTS